MHDFIRQPGEERRVFTELFRVGREWEDDFNPPSKPKKTST